MTVLLQAVVSARIIVNGVAAILCLAAALELYRRYSKAGALRSRTLRYLLIMFVMFAAANALSGLSDIAILVRLMGFEAWVLVNSVSNILDDAGAGVFALFMLGYVNGSGHSIMRGAPPIAAPPSEAPAKHDQGAA